MAQTFFKVLAPQEARQLLLAVEPLDTERIQSVKGRGRVLAEDLYSVVDLPHFNRAAMDGYAVKAKDTGENRDRLVFKGKKWGQAGF